MNYNQLINKLYNETNCNSCGNIDDGCCISDRISLTNTQWEDSNKIFEWKCGHHKAFLLSLAEKSIYDIVHKLDIKSYEQILSSSQINTFKKNFNKLMKECVICKSLKNVENNLKPFYRLPIDTNNDMIINVSKLILDKDIRTNNPILLDLEERKGIGLYVFHSSGFSKIPIKQYYPIWQLYKKYITFDVISSWNKNIDGLEINDHLLISLNDSQIITYDTSCDDFIDLQNDMNAPIQILNNSVCYITNYNQLNKDQLDILIKNYDKVIIDYLKFQLIIKSNKFCIQFNGQIIKF